MGGDLRRALRRSLENLGGQWKGPLLFLEDPRVSLEHNATVRALRGPVQERKNHNGSRSRCGTEVVALFYSLLEGALLNGIDPCEYLRVSALAAIAGQTLPLPHELIANNRP